MAARNSITAADVRKALHYDPETGVLTWRHRPDRSPQWNARYAGREAGTPHRRTDNLVYVRIKLNGHTYRAHRLAWLYMTGEWPKGRIDHKSGDGLDNRWVNIRPATHGQNMGNRRVGRNNRTGVKGVTHYRNRYQAHIWRDGRQHHLGTFNTLEEAASAYGAAAREHFGEFARTA